MLRQCIELCPDQLWISGAHPRTTWRIAFHAVYFTHLYLMPDQKAFKKWKGTNRHHAELWGEPPQQEAFAKQEVLTYLDFVIESMPAWLDEMNLDGAESGFSYYPNMAKFEHQFVNLRHLQGHVGQLSELLMQQGVFTDWVSRSGVTYLI